MIVSGIRLVGWLVYSWEQEQPGPRGSFIDKNLEGRYQIAGGINVQPIAIFSVV